MSGCLWLLTFWALGGDQFLPLRVETQEGRWQLATGDVRLKGVARCEFPQGWLQGEEVRGNLAESRWEGSRLQGFLRFPSHRWDPRQLVDPRDLPQGIVLSAQRARVLGSQVELEGVRLTTCEEPRPHYWLSFRRFTLFPDGRAKVERPSLGLGRRSLLSLPTFAFRALGRPIGGLPLPRLGRNQQEGLFLQWEQGFQEGGGDILLRLRLTQGAGFTGGAFWQREGPWGMLRISLTHRETLWEDVDVEARLSRVPEVRWHFLHPFGKNLEGSGGLEWGRYAERPQRARAWRWGAWLQLRGQVGHWRGWSLHEGLGYRKSWYSGQGSLEVGEIGLGLSRLWRQRVYLRLDHWYREDRGRTPFFFDDLDFPRELQSTLRWRWGRAYVAGWDGRYDFRHRRFEQLDWVLLRRYHHLEVGLRWRTGRWQGVTLEGGLLGF